jgi:type IV pilus assembly protein PilY1
MNTHRSRRPCLSAGLAFLGLLLAAHGQTALADITDIASGPLFASSTSNVKPNLMFILDDSGSMNWSYTPDELGDGYNTSDRPYDEWRGYWSSQCNGLAYDPTNVYLPPVDSTGVPYANISFSAAPTDGYVASSSKANLSSRYYYSYNGNGGVKQPALNWQYTTQGVVQNTFYNECKLTSGSVFTKVDLSDVSTAQKQNYANWYSYYRKRYLVMRTGVGMAFSNLSDQYRVGFSTINYTGSTDGSEFLNIEDFTSNQKEKFFSTLYANKPEGGTPLRAALAKAGRYFGKKLKDQAVDPVQYMCQKNFSILSTDGYWNGSAGTDLSGKSIGNQDGVNMDPSARPKYDAGAASVTNTARWTTVRTLVERTTTTTDGKSIKNKKLEEDGCDSTGSGSSRRYSCDIKVETDDDHNLKDGDTVTISGASPAGYNGTFIIDVKKKDEFTYTASGLTVEIKNDANPDGVTSTACSAALPRTRTVATTTTVTTTTNVQVQIVVNGAITSDITTPSSRSSDNTVTTQECVSSNTPTGVVNVTVSDTGEVEGAKTTTSTTTSTGGSSGSLADVAFYYFNTDLRDGTAWDNCVGGLGSGTSVCGTVDKFQKQNMVTFGIGLGLNGTLRFDKNYITQTNPGSGDFYDLKNGTKSWPVPSDGGNAENVDDLWHAAVNSTDFGTVALPVAKPNTQYFSAQDPSQLINSLNSALDTIKQIVGSASAAATSTLQPVPGDNDLFVAKFTSAKWYGDVQRFSIDPNTGAMSDAASWSAGAVLDARDLVANPRKVYFLKSGALDDFNYTKLSAAGLNGHFDNFCSKSGLGGNSTPLQCGLIADKTAANTGGNLVAYLLGAANDNYRARDSRLGDIISGAPLFVGAPKFKYTEHDYAAWAATTRQGECAGSTAGNRKYQGTVYVGANDGMLHAFDRCDGSEKWAYVPSMVIPNLYKLADTGYPNNHQFYVDGAPVMGDIFVDGAWKTILVGGLNAGGRGYYALDVTNPASPKALWEFTNSDNANLGLTFGNPVITKRADGTWVVAFASGYNNVSGGDGNGHLIVINANTGAALADIPTLASSFAVGSTTTPSGLAKINAWVDSETDNTAKRFYGGDLLGNIWRFDLDSVTKPYGKAFQLAQLAVGGVAQPVTIMPELAEVNYLGAKYAVVYVGTGRYLGTGDLSNTDRQTIYAFKDALSETGLGDLRLGNTLVAQTLTTSSTNSRIRTATKTAVDWSTKNGWSVDLPTSGERVNVGMVLAFNVLSVASTVPSATACEIGGTSWLYKLDIATGSAVANAPENAAGLMLEEGKLIVGQTVVQLMDGSATTLSTLSDGNLRSDLQPPPPSNAVLRRTSWRELAN